jgi:hypothetical protein
MASTQYTNGVPQYMFQSCTELPCCSVPLRLTSTPQNMALNLSKNKPSTPAVSDASNPLAFQHNHLIRTPLRMGTVEARIFIHALAQVHQTDKAFKPLKIPVSAVVGHEPNGEDYRGVHASCSALVGQILNLLPIDAKRGRLHKVPLMAEIALDPGTGFITGQFNEKAKPYLLNLKAAGNFTSANVETLLTFTNTNSARLYWILLSYRNMEGPRVQIELADLKLWMLTTDTVYPSYTEFKRRVLDPIEEDFQRIGFKATWEPIKTGKKITALLFSIPKEKKPKALPAAAASPQQPPSAAAAFTTWLSSADPRLQQAHGELLGKHQLTKPSAANIIRWLADQPEETKLEFFRARHRAQTHTGPVVSMRHFTLASINAALGTAFK